MSNIVPASFPEARNSSRPSILTKIVVEHGDTDLFSQLFLKAEYETRRAGVQIGFASFDDLVEANAANSDNWGPLLTIFNPRFKALTSRNSFCILGWSAEGYS